MRMACIERVSYSAQLVPLSRYWTVQTVIVTYFKQMSASCNWCCLNSVFWECLYLHLYCFSRSRMFSTAALILGWASQDFSDVFYCIGEEISYLIPGSVAMAQNAKKIRWRIELLKYMQDILFIWFGLCISSITSSKISFTYSILFNTCHFINFCKAFKIELKYFLCYVALWPMNNKTNRNCY